MVLLKLLCAVAVLGTQLSSASAAGCSAMCDGDTGELTFTGVDDVILVDGANTISLQNEQADIEEMIVSTNETVVAASEVVDTDMGELLESANTLSKDRMDKSLYETLRAKINAQRLAIRKEREVLNRHLECGRDGLIWHAEDETCIPAMVPHCGPLPTPDNRVRSLVDCTGIIGTECATHCDAGWSGENVTYFCTGTNDDKGGWQRIAAHGALDQGCVNIDECSMPDYPCNHNSYHCTDSDGSFTCACDETMQESDEKVQYWPDGAINGHGEECVCKSETQWLVLRDAHPPAPYCTCPAGGTANMVIGKDGDCECEPFSVPEKKDGVPFKRPYPNLGLTGILNQDEDLNPNVHCNFLTDCQQAYDVEFISRNVNTFTHNVKLKAPMGEQRFVDATCIVAYVGGVQAVRAMTHIKCNDLIGQDDYTYRCDNTNNVFSANTCTKNGYIMAPFRSKEHYLTMYKAFTYPNQQVNGVTGSGRGRWNTNAWWGNDLHRYHDGVVPGIFSSTSRDYATRRGRWRWNRGWRYVWDNSKWYPMHSDGKWNGEAKKGGSKATTGYKIQGAGQWQSIDKGPWWLSNNYRNEPSGDYNANNFLQMWWHWHPSNVNQVNQGSRPYFNDGWSAWSNKNYMCGHAFY